MKERMNGSYIQSYTETRIIAGLFGGWARVIFESEPVCGSCEQRVGSAVKLRIAREGWRDGEVRGRGGVAGEVGEK